MASTSGSVLQLQAAKKNRNFKSFGQKKNSKRRYNALGKRIWRVMDTNMDDHHGLLVQYGEDSEDEGTNTPQESLQLPQEPKSDDPKTIFFKKLLKYKDDPDADYLVKGEENRGKFRMSQNGKCPRCNAKSVVFVILDYLFPAGDMPGILSYLISKGQAVLWSSQDNSKCKEPPTFMCRGKCPSEPQKSGFNLNWNKSDLGKIFLFPEEDKQIVKTTKEKLGTISVKGLTAKKQENAAPSRSFSWEIHIEGKTLAEKKPVSVERQISVQEKVSLEAQSIPETILSDEKESVVEKTNDETEEFDPDQCDMNHYRRKVSWVVLDEEAENKVDKNAKEEDLFIRYMLALEEAREDWEKGQAKLLELISDAESAGLEDMNISDDENSTQIEVSVPTIDKSIYSIHDRPDLTSPWNTPNVPKNGKRSSDSSTTSITPTVPSYTGQNSLRPSVSALNVSYLRGTNFPMQYRPNVTNPSYRARMTYSQMRSFNPNIRGMITSQVTPIKSTSTMPLQSTPSQITYSSTPILYKGSDEASVSSTGASGTVTSPTPTITTSYTFSSATTAGTDSVTFTVPASASTEATTTTVTATTTETKQKYSLEDFPVSKDGICPYCKSSDVLYIILMHENSKDDDLPPILKGLLQQGKAYKMPKGDYEPPSFQCRSCTYGFNLDWTSTNLEEIFIKEKPSAPTTTTAADNVTVATTSPKTSVSQKFVSKRKIPGTTAATLPTQTKPRNPNFNPKARQQFPQLPSEMPVQPFMPNMPFAMPNMPFPMPIPGFGMMPFMGMDPTGVPAVIPPGIPPVMHPMQWNQGFFPQYNPAFNPSFIPPQQQLFQQEQQQTFDKQQQKLIEMKKIYKQRKRQRYARNKRLRLEMQMAYDDVGMTSEDQIEDGSEHYDEITDDKSPLSREDDETIENEFHEEETDEVLPGIPGEDDSALPHATKNESAIETNEPVSYENGSHSHRDDTVQQEDHDDDNLRAPGTDESMDDTHFVMDTVQNKGTPKTSVGKDQHSSLQKHDVVNKLTTDSQATKHHSENSAKKANDKETESSSVKPSPTSNQVAPSTKESDKNSSEPKSSQRGRGRGRGKGVRGGRGGRGGRGKKRGGK